MSDQERSLTPDEVKVFEKWECLRTGTHKTDSEES